MATVLGAILKIWKPIIFVIGFAIIIGLIGAWIGLIVGFFASLPFSSFLIESSFFRFLGITNLFFVVGLPIIGIIRFVGRFVFDKKPNTRFGTGLTVFWVFNVISLFSVGSMVVRDLNQEGEFSKVQELNITSDTMRLNFAKEKAENSILNIDGVKILDNNLVMNSIAIGFEKSPDNQFRLIKTYFSRGRNSSQVEKYTQEIEYEATINNNEITFPSDFLIKKGSLWRNQCVDLILQVPEGKTIQFGTDNRNRIYRFVRHRSEAELKRPPVYWEGVHTWTMQEKGWYSKEDAQQEVGAGQEFKNFKKILIKGELKVNISKGDKYEVKLVGKERQWKNVKMEQMGEILDISCPTKRRSSPVRLNITAPDLDRIDLEYTDDVNIKGFDGKKLDVFNEGRREVKVFVDVDSLYLNFKRNKSDIRGNGKYLKVKLDNGARMDAEHFVAKNAYINAKNAGKIRLEVTDTLRTDLINGSRMVYEDSPAVTIDERKRKKE